MSPENVGQQFVTLYRGLGGKRSLKHIDFDNIGRHWTTDPEVAESFALDYPGPRTTFLHGFVVHAQIPAEHIIDPSSEEWKKMSVRYGMYGPGHGEEEHTIREGAPVSIHKIQVVHKTADNDITNTEMKRFPRQGRA